MAHDDLRNDEQFVLELIGKQATALYGAGDDLLRDPDFVAEAVRRYPPLLDRSRVSQLSSAGGKRLTSRKTGF